MGELYGRLKTNLMNLLFLRNIVEDNEALQNTSQEPGVASTVFSPE